MGSSYQDSQLRNDFMHYLVRNCKDAHLKKPFNEKPPRGPMKNVHHMLPDKYHTGHPHISIDEQKNEEDGGAAGGSGGGAAAQPSGYDLTQRKIKGQLFDRSPDKGAFLVGQPVPRCGAFCYLAVVSRQPEK